MKLKTINVLLTEPLEEKIIQNPSDAGKEGYKLVAVSYTEARWFGPGENYYEKDLKELFQRRLLEIPPRFREAELEKCPQFVIDYCLNGDWKEKGLYLWGKCGVGKTYIAYAIKKLIRIHGTECKVMSLIDILNLIKEDFRIKQQEFRGPTNFDDLLNLEGVLIIDDIGVEKITDWVLETLYALVNKRYEYKLTTIFTSNLSLDDLAERLGDRIPSRIAEMCIVKKLEGQDKRLLKH